MNIIPHHDTRWRGRASPNLFREPSAAVAERIAGEFERLGYLGEFFQVCASQPDALYHFNRFTEVLKAALPGNLVGASCVDALRLERQPL